MSSRRTLFRIHSWLGLNLGLLLFICCFSGTVATLSHEIDWLLNPAMRADSRGPDAWSWERWSTSIRARHPGALLLQLAAPPADGWAARGTVAYGPSDWRHVYVHPDTGDVQGTFSQFNVARFFRSFHKQFYIYPGALPHGIYAVGPLAVVLLLSAITALFFYRIRWNDMLLRQRSASARTWWSSLHRASGVWTLVFTLVFAVTGIWYLVERAAVDVGMPIGRAEVLASRVAVDAPEGARRLDLDSCVASARAAFPTLDVRSIFVPRSDDAAITLYGQADAWLVRGTANYVVVDPYSGAVLDRRDAADLPLGARLMQTADPLHFGNFAGLSVKLVWFVAGLLISLSVLAGVRIWHLRVNQSRARQQEPAAGIGRGGLVVTLGVLALTTYGSIVNIGNSIAHTEPPPLAGVALAAGAGSGDASPAASAAQLVPLYVWGVVGGFVLCTALLAVLVLAVLRPGRRRA